MTTIDMPTRTRTDHLVVRPRRSVTTIDEITAEIEAMTATVIDDVVVEEPDEDVRAWAAFGYDGPLTTTPSRPRGSFQGVTVIDGPHPPGFFGFLATVHS